MAKYRQTVAEQRKRVASRERRVKERARLNQRAITLHKRARTVQEKRTEELDAACDDAEDAWVATHWSASSGSSDNSSNSAGGRMRSEKKKIKRQGTARQKHRMRARVEVLKTFEEFDHCAGDYSFIIWHEKVTQYWWRFRVGSERL